MGVKYILQVKSHDGVAWECLISTSSYSATPLVLRGVSEQSFKLDYSGDSADEPYNTFIKSTLSLDVYNQGQIDINELQQAGDKDFLAKLFRNGLLYWTGYLKPED